MYKGFIARTRRLLLYSEDMINILVALLLLGAGVGVIFLTAQEMAHGFGAHLVMAFIHNALLVLIIKEVMWTVIKFLGRQEFSITSFYRIGMISAVRHLLWIEANTANVGKPENLYSMGEFLATAVVILLLSIGYYYVKRLESLRNYAELEAEEIRDRE